MTRTGGREQSMGVRALFLAASVLAAGTLNAAAVELIDPHDVLNQTRRDMIESGKRVEQYGAERQKKEREQTARQKQEVAEQQKQERAEKAHQELNERAKPPSSRSEREKRRSKRLDRSRKWLRNRNRPRRP
jgi:hypothetical protein